jgi:hypothetical protein
MDTSPDHEHHHAAVSHTPSAHQDPDKEHGREAHIHDHEQPAQSPADADPPAAARERALPTFAQVPSGPDCLDSRGRHRLTLAAARSNRRPRP